MSSLYQPLADRMRPTTIDEVVGQNHLLGKGKPLAAAIAANRLHSMVFWGPPGTGKTTIARLLANQFEANFISLSAVLSGVKEIRDAVQQAQTINQPQAINTVLFVDEVHRFNKSQQDAFLPHIEDGTILFIGATTENPSFELNNALLSRVRVYLLKSISTDELTKLIFRTLEDNEKGLGKLALSISKDAAELIAQLADGDARRALTMLEVATDLCEGQQITEELVNTVFSAGISRRFDKGGEAFYDQISALHKSVRGSDPDAALYWLCRMLDGGCDPIYLARRLVRIASEDIGNADPRALRLALDAWETQERLGSPEGELALAQATIYLSVAAKSNASYVAYKAAMKNVTQNGSLEIPLHLRNAPTKLMKSLDYGKGYSYSHDEPEAFSAKQRYFPDNMEEAEFYQPVERGMEIKIAEKLAYLRSLKKT